MTPNQVRLVRAGEIITLEPEDAWNLTRPMRFRVAHIPRDLDVAALEWVHLIGVELDHRGNDVAHRHIVCRASVLIRNSATP